MQPPILNGVKNFLSKRIPTLKNFSLEWFGGEPLLAWKQLLDISAHAQQLCKETDCRFIPGGLTTNGFFLNAEMMAKLVAVEQRGFQISLDGDEDQHNITRVAANGSGTFDRIYGNLLELVKTTHNFHITLRLHMTPDNRDSLNALCRKLAQDILHDRRFSIFLKPISDWGGKNSGNIESIDYLSAKERVEEITAIGAAVGFGRVTSHIANAAPGGDFIGICYAAEANTFIIRSTGQLAKCTVGFEDPLNNIGNLNEDGTLTLKQDVMNKWLSGLGTRDSAELACPYSHVKKTSKIIPIMAMAG